jgi:DNA-binding transcriptional LysR family regulator
VKDIETLAAFVAVARSGSFTTAAAQLGVSKATVSKRVAALEAELGLPLLHRTTRQVVPTDAGDRLLAQAAPALDSLARAREDLRDDQDEPTGLIRLTAPVSYGVQTITPSLTALLLRHPRLQIAASFTDKPVDLLAEGFDLAIRIGELPDSSLRARRLGSIRRLLCASPSYLAAHGQPACPADLRNHRCLHYTWRQSGTTWSFPTEDGGLESIPVTGPVMVDSGEALRCMALGGLGIAQLPDHIVADDLDNGRLVPILEDYPEAPRTVWAVLPPGRQMSNKVRLLVDFLVEQIKEAPTRG